MKLYKLLIIIIPFFCLSVYANNDNKKENIIFIIVDDLRDLDMADNQLQILTPNIDKLKKSGVTFKNSFTVIPRLGTISPWSSKATEILRNCGMNFLDRVERGFYYSFSSKRILDLEEIRELSGQLTDRMTQGVMLDIKESKNIFSILPPKEVINIPMFEEGISAIEQANTSLGLALSEDEIKIIGYGHKESRGLIGCNISDMRLAQKSIISTVAEAEKMAGLNNPTEPPKPTVSGAVISGKTILFEANFPSFFDNAKSIEGIAASNGFFEM